MKKQLCFSLIATLSMAAMASVAAQSRADLYDLARRIFK